MIYENSENNPYTANIGLNWNQSNKYLLPRFAHIFYNCHKHRVITQQSFVRISLDCYVEWKECCVKKKKSYTDIPPKFKVSNMMSDERDFFMVSPWKHSLRSHSTSPLSLHS